MAEIKDYVGNNDQILEEWKAKFLHIRGVENEWKFAPDGIMNKGDFDKKAFLKDGVWWRKRSDQKGTKENDLWSNAPLRILFLTKDENLYDGDISAWDVREETFYANSKEREQNAISGSFFYQNEMCMLYGLLHTDLQNGLCDYEDFSWKEALDFSNEQIFARVNCKKEGGESTLNNKDLQDAIDKDFDLLKRQIIALDADIFICCGSQNENNIILNALYAIYDNEFNYVPYRTDRGTGTHYNAKHNKLAFDAYHLAYNRCGGLKARYYETVEAYFEFIKYLKESKGIDFTASHRINK
ncbi:MAG: hypothetical protein IJQ95_00955 [Paludibacteraceae bacterium]|nr:hypothetical protein [Paludibacteraceae bacterium]